jgi:hypothetical protein
MLSKRLLNAKILDLVPYLSRLRVAAEDRPANAKPRDLFGSKAKVYDLFTRMMFLAGYYEEETGIVPQKTFGRNTTVSDILKRMERIAPDGLNKVWTNPNDTGFMARSMTGMFSLLANEFGPIGALELTESVIKDTFLVWLGGAPKGSDSDSGYANMFGYAMSANLNKFRLEGKKFAKEGIDLSTRDSLNHAANIISKNYRNVGVDLLRKVYSDKAWGGDEATGLRRSPEHKKTKQKDIEFLNKGIDNVVAQWSEAAQSPDPKSQQKAKRLKGQLDQMIEALTRLETPKDKESKEYKRVVEIQAKSRQLLETIEKMVALKSKERAKLRRLIKDGYNHFSTEYQEQAAVIRDLSSRIANMQARLSNLRLEAGQVEKQVQLRRETNAPSWTERDVNLFILGELLMPESELNNVEFSEVRDLWFKWRELWKNRLLGIAERMNPDLLYYPEGTTKENIQFAYYLSRMMYLKEMVNAVNDENKEIREKMSDPNLTDDQRHNLKVSIGSQHIETIQRLNKDRLYDAVMAKWPQHGISNKIPNPFTISPRSKYPVEDFKTKSIKDFSMKLLKATMSTLRSEESDLFDRIEEAVMYWQTQGTPGSAQWPGRFAAKRIKEIKTRRLIRQAMLKK